MSRARKGYIALPRWMFDHPQWPTLAPSAKEMLYALLDLADLKDPETLDELAVRARVSTRSAERAMPQLVALGWFQKIGGTGRRKAEYMLCSTAKSGGATPPVVPPKLAGQDRSTDTLSDSLSAKSGGATDSLYLSSTPPTPSKSNNTLPPTKARRSPSRGRNRSPSLAGGGGLGAILNHQLRNLRPMDNDARAADKARHSAVLQALRGIGVTSEGKASAIAQRQDITAEDVHRMFKRADADKSVDDPVRVVVYRLAGWTREQIDNELSAKTRTD